MGLGELLSKGLKKIPKKKALVAGGVVSLAGYEYGKHTSSNPDADGECGYTDIVCILGKIKDDIKVGFEEILMWTAIGLVVAVFVYALVSGAAKSTIEAGKETFRNYSNRIRSNGGPQGMGGDTVIAVPSTDYGVDSTINPTGVGGGGKKNNLDKYMYCLILLLGIGIHHLYENYKSKEDEYSDLLKKKEEDKLFY